MLSTFELCHQCAELSHFTKLTTLPIQWQLPITLGPWQPPFYFLFLWCWLLQIPYPCQYWSSCDWCILLSTTSSKFIHILADVRKLKKTIVCIHHIHLPTYLLCGHLGSFWNLWLLCIVLLGTWGTNIFLRSCFRFFFIYIPRNGIAGSYGHSSFYLFWGDFILFSSGCTTLRSPYPQQYLSLFFDHHHLSGCQEILWFWFAFT